MKTHFLVRAVSMAIEVEGKTLETDEEGFLLNPGQWNETVAAHIAVGEKLELTPARWEIVRYVCEHFEARGTVPEARTLLKMSMSGTVRKSPRVSISTGCFRMATANRPAKSPACACREN